MPLQHAYRPTKIDDLWGNEAVKDSVKALFSRREKDLPHAFLLTGPSGCGKTTLARIIKSHLGINDWTEIDASSDRGIDQIRYIKQTLSYASMMGGRKGILFDEVHGVTANAQEAMLTMLEDPPPHAYLFLATTNPEKLKKTIHRRCHQYELESMTRGDIVGLLKHIVSQEFEHPEDFPDDVISEIAKNCWGSPGQAVKLLDLIIDLEEPEAMMKAIHNVAGNETEIIELSRVLIRDENFPNKWSKARKILSNLKGSDAESNRLAILGYFHNVLISDSTNNHQKAAEIIACYSDSVMYTGKAGLALATYMACGGE